MADATLQDRVREWMDAAVTLDDAVYIPLRTDWMPNGTRRTADGVELLLAGRWPPEIDAESGPRISGAVFGRVWEIVCDADISPDFSGIATCGLYEENNEQSANRAQNEAPAAEEEPVADMVAAPAIPDAAIPLHLIDGWPWSHVVTEIRTWAAIYPEEIPDPNEISEAEARALLKTMLQHPAVIAEAERRRMVAEATRQEYRDARTIQYAIYVGVDLPDPTPPPVTQEFSCTDDGNGDRLVAQYRDSIRYCKTFDAWFIWSGSRWERDETCRMLALAKRVARTIHLEASATTDDRREKVGKWALSSGMLSRLKAMIACACPAVAVTPDEFDAHPTLLNCQNGTLELDTLTFREARREDLLTKCAGVAYDPAAECPTWLAHLDLIFNGDAEVIEGFRQMAGYSLLDGNPEQVMFILLGRGKNGKSVTLKVLAEVLGDYAVNLAAESLMVKRNDVIRSDLARLMGARLVTSAEGGEGAALDEGAVKQLTGFDDKITVARKYENEFEFTPGAKIWFATNHAPRIRGTDDGIWRRIWLIPFEVQIPEERRDPQITEKLLQEKAGILNWMLAGLRQYHAQGHRLRPADKIVAATRAYRRESDAIGRFLADEMIYDPQGSVTRAGLYSIYSEWCKVEGEPPVASRTIAKYLRERQIQETKRGGARCWIGIRVKNTMEAEQDAAAGSVQAGL
ncbi:MAG TPA: phage/plasmid primase, P4 family [Methanoculleus sp.]|nr:phage/plasmid primase, P4 family [Methanoculleus sp.]